MNKKNIVLFLMLLFISMSCSKKTNQNEILEDSPKNIFPITVNYCKIIELDINGEKHEYIYSRHLNDYCLVHSDNCKYCKNK